MGCPADSDCIALELTQVGALDPSWILDPAGNITCTEDGLLSPKLLSPLACLFVPQATLTPSLGSSSSQFGPIATLTNPSPTRAMLAVCSVLFGTPQITIGGQGNLQITDRVGFGASGTLLPGTYPVVNTSGFTHHPTFAGPIDYAFNHYNYTTWTCPFPVAPGASVDASFERRAALSGPATATGIAVLRTTFVYMWGIVT